MANEQEASIQELVLGFVIFVVYFALGNTLLALLSSTYPSPDLYWESSLLLVVLGIIAIAVSLFVVKIRAISTPLLIAGSLLVIEGATYYYIASQTLLEKSVVLIFAFIVLIIIGYAKFSNKK